MVTMMMTIMMAMAECKFPNLFIISNHPGQFFIILSQETHKEAMRILVGEGVDYGTRKLASYAQPVAYFLLLEKAVEESQSERCQQLWVQAVKDRQTFLLNYMAELKSSQAEIDKMMDDSVCLGGCPTCACGKESAGVVADQPAEVAWEVIENVVEDILTQAEGLDKAEVRKVLVLHDEKDKITQNLSISHTNAEASFLKKTWEQLGLPRKHQKIKGPKSKTFVRKTSKVPESMGGCKGSNTQAVFCYQINIQDFSQDLKERVLTFFDKQEIIPDDVEVQATQSQDYLQFHQSQDTLLYCKLCQFQGESSASLKIHMEETHVKCKVCKKTFCDERNLQEHVQMKHTEIICTQCGESVPEQNMENHMISHKQREGFKKVLENVGKIRGKGGMEKFDKRIAYKLFIEETKEDTRRVVDEENPEMTNREKSQLVTKKIAEDWKKMSHKEQEDFGKRKLEDNKRRKAAVERGENITNLTDKDDKTPRVTRCKDCGKVCLGEQHLMRHQIGSHSLRDDENDEILRDEFEPEVREERREQVEMDRERERQDQLGREELERMRETRKEQNEEVEIVMVKEGQDFWPAKVLQRKRGRTVVERFCEAKQKLSLSDSDVEPLDWKAKTARSEAAFKRARRFQRGQELIER